VSGLEKFLLLEFGQVPHKPMEEGSAPSQAKFCCVKWALNFRAIQDPHVLRFLRLPHGLRAVSLFTRREHSGDSELTKLIALNSVVLDGVVKRHLTVFEIYVGTSSF